ncbi:MAG: alpha-L-arabinofuranosidase, partial [Segetibacter sp.]
MICKRIFWTLTVALVTSLFGCKKSIEDVASTPPVPPVVTTPAVDPAVANTIGFFLDDWTPKTFSAPAFIDTAVPAAGTTTINIDASKIITKIPPAIYGNNANTYMTQMVTEPVLIDYIKNLKPNIIRFPGGNLSSVYFWNASAGTKPSDAPDSLVDANGARFLNGYWYGKNTENWTLSLDNYYAMLQQTGNKGIITVNYGYARYGTSSDPAAQAAHLAADWVRYDNGRTKYWEIGNESNGTWQAGYRMNVSKNRDGQPEIITGDLYGQHYKVFADSMRKAAASIGKTIYIGAQLLEREAPSYATATDKNWNAGVFSKAGSVADYYIVHSYFIPYKQNSTASVILNSAVAKPKRMMDYVKSNATNNASSVKPLALTEWNIFATGSMQMVSHVNGLHADLVLGELLTNKYGMASRWDLANAWDNGNDHGMFNNGNETGVPKWNPRPVFYHMYYFQKMMGDRLISSSVTGNPDVSAYSSTFNNTEVGAPIVNR